MPDAYRAAASVSTHAIGPYSVLARAQSQAERGHVVVGERVVDRHSEPAGADEPGLLERLQVRRGGAQPETSGARQVGDAAGSRRQQLEQLQAAPAAQRLPDPGDPVVQLGLPYRVTHHFLH